MYNFLVLTSQHGLGLLTYSFSVELPIGTAVIAPLRNKEVKGIIVKKLDDTDQKYKIKNIISVLSELQIKPSLLKFIQDLAKYYMLDESSLCKMVLAIPFKNIELARKIEHNFDYKLPTLSISQEEAYRKLKNSSKTCLLYGVTGSGKTEIYFHLIMDIIKKGGQVLLMLPEIGLVSQIKQRFKSAFGIEPPIWHSGISPTKKRDVFCGIASGDCKIVIGTRSSLFLPFQDLRLIIIDEEHDGSYKQEEGSLYNARDSAVLRSSIEGAKIILASATPSIETYENAMSGKYDLIEVKERYNDAWMPIIQIIDMKKQERGNWISAPLRNSIAKALSQRKQVILFINRKGFAPLMLCGSCGFRFTCTNCSSWLVYHKEKAKLLCHHCGYNVPFQEECPDCSEKSLIPCGPGVERVANEASELFKEARIVKFIREEDESEDDHALITKIQNREVDIIVGTQILTKGYHFPHVTVVGVIDGDTGLSNIDLKASERAFQVLSQVSGRAGREEDIGESFIQTYIPENPIFAYIKEGAKGFYKTEIENRRDAIFPPFARIVAIIVSGEVESQALALAKEIRHYAPKIERVRILGPAPATLSKLRGKYRFRILLIADKLYNLQHYAASIVARFKLPSNLHIRTEVDPYSFY